MADWVHCNGCFVCPPSKEVKFLLTSCGHMFCSNCYSQPGAPCIMCKSKCMITPLKPNMSPDVQLFFMDPMDVAAKLHKQLMKVLDFQRTQRKRLTAYRLQKLNNLQTKEQCETLRQELRRLQDENNNLRHMISVAKDSRTVPRHSPRESRTLPRQSPSTPLHRPRHSSKSSGGNFAQVLGSRITPPPAIFQTPKTTSPSPRSLEDCKRSVEYNSKRMYRGYSATISR